MQFLRAWIKIKQISTVEVSQVFLQQSPWTLQLSVEKTCTVWENTASFCICISQKRRRQAITRAFFSVHRKNAVDPEDPRCARLTLTGQMVMVPPEETEFAKQAMFSRSVCDMHIVSYSLQFGDKYIDAATWYRKPEKQQAWSLLWGHKGCWPGTTGRASQAPFNCWGNELWKHSW